MMLAAIHALAAFAPPLSAAPSLPPPVAGDRAANPRIQAMVDAVDQTNLDATVTYLNSIPSRKYNHAGAVTAQNWIVAQFQGLGLTTTLQDCGYPAQNVFAELPGSADPAKIVVLGAHYDSTASGTTGLAPGADDNASGVSGVLEAARVLVPEGPYEYTIRFVAFAAEEIGLVGSSAAAQQSAALGEEIVAMINLDMIAHLEPGDVMDVDVMTDNTSVAFSEYYAALGTLYVPGWAWTWGTWYTGNSDHSSYMSEGFPAIWLCEDASEKNPYYHTVNDTNPLSTNCFDLAEMITRGTVATVATLAGVVDLQIDHVALGDTQSAGPYDVDCQVASLSGANVSSVTLQYSTDGIGFTPVAMTYLGGNDYRGQIPDAGAPVTHCYYIEAADDQGGHQTLPRGRDLGRSPLHFFCGQKRVIYFNDFEGADDEGWTHAEVVTQDDWQRGRPMGQPYDPVHTWSGDKAWANDLGWSGWNGEYKPDVENWLRSPVFDLSNEPSVILHFRRWLTVQDGRFDQAQIRVNDSVVWQNVAGADHLDAGWHEETLDITALAAGNPAVQIEFRLLSDSTVQYGGWNIDDFSLVAFGPFNCPDPTNYCVTSPNSVGPGATIGYGGTTSVSANDLELTVQGAPADQFALFYYGPNQISIPFGEGVRCVGGGIYRLKVVQMDAFGAAAHALDITSPSQPSGQILDGSTWNFQCWYRDPSGGPSGFNFSDGLEVVFCP